jgi:hypothetical protein
MHTRLYGYRTISSPPLRVVSKDDVLEKDEIKLFVRDTLGSDIILAIKNTTYVLHIKEFISYMKNVLPNQVHLMIGKKTINYLNEIDHFIPSLKTEGNVMHLSIDESLL